MVVHCFCCWEYSSSVYGEAARRHRRRHRSSVVFWFGRQRRFIFFCRGLFVEDISPSSFWISLLVLFLSFLSFLKLSRVVPSSYFPRRTFTFTLSHTNNIIMSSAVSSYLVLVSLYLFFFLLSHSLFLSLECVVGVL